MSSNSMENFDGMLLFDDSIFDFREPSPAPSSQYWFDENSLDSRSSTPGLQSASWLDNSLYQSRDSSPAPQSMYCPSPDDFTLGQYDDFGSPYRRPNRRRTRRHLQRSLSRPTSFTENDMEFDPSNLPSRNLMEQIAQEQARASSPAASNIYAPGPELGNPYARSHSRSQSRHQLRKNLQKPINTNLSIPKNDDLEMLSPSPIRAFGGFDKNGNNLFLQNLASGPQLPGPFGSVQPRRTDLSSLWADFDTSNLITPTQATFQQAAQAIDDEAPELVDLTKEIEQNGAEDPNIAFLDSIASEYSQKTTANYNSFGEPIDDFTTVGYTPSSELFGDLDNSIPSLDEFLPDPFNSTPNFQNVNNQAGSNDTLDIFTANPMELLRNTATNSEFTTPAPPPRPASTFPTNFTAPTPPPRPTSAYDPTAAPRSRSNFRSLPARIPRPQSTCPPRSTPTPHVDRTATDPQLLFLESLPHPPAKPTFTAPSHRRARSAATPEPLARQSSGLSFVNFTMGDGDTLLSGVAPSGSGKTKMKREREQEVVREKIKAVARRAIEEVGGDVGVLERVAL
ncbi:hypothetical protein BJ508DRAFT_311264 [Ascobolus immersus RN42]|uniref:Uncharacterized protein n=1 Tax=Ascobolus immersus RN42 TaxID=1160509 RepID=A0A3N4HUP8_ASCIM|nr:hypothetical protein BJ508DRAFT_311264 [Ascobolus immersus RN42]